MPKVVPDLYLLTSVKAWILDRRMNQRQAARALGVNPATLCRFLKSGCALESTKNVIRETLLQRPTIAISPEEEKMIDQNATFTQENIALLRKMLHYLVDAVDAFDKSQAAAVDFNSRHGGSGGA